MKSSLILLCAMMAWGAVAQVSPSPGNFKVSPEFPKYVTAHVEFRDPTGQRWPSFFYGKPASAGTISIAGAKPNASVAFQCDKRPQKNGDQSRRVLGEIFPSAQDGIVRVQIEEISPVASLPNGKKEEFQTTFIGSVDVAGRKIAMTAPGTLRVHQGGRSDEKNEALFGELQFDVKASDIGLKTFAPDALIRIGASFTAYVPDAGVRRAPVR